MNPKIAAAIGPKCPVCEVARRREYNLTCANCYRKMSQNLRRQVHTMDPQTLVVAIVREQRGRRAASELEDRLRAALG